MSVPVCNVVCSLTKVLNVEVTNELVTYSK